ncbi:MAG: hypothetical protein WDZ45_14570 [Flavobacteriaceae bacterium]
MTEIHIKKYIRYFFGVSILLFVLNKLYLRPWVIENELSGFVLMVTNSIPNLLEAIIGTLITTGILLQLHFYFTKTRTHKNLPIRIFAVVIAAIYVISQEIKFHNLGGNNVYDPFDLIASVIGLVGTFMIIQLFGFVDDPKD